MVCCSASHFGYFKLAHGVVHHQLGNDTAGVFGTGLTTVTVQDLKVVQV
jgi:hypothetical protein